MIYVPCPTQTVAMQIVKTLLESRLAGCGNIYPSKSMYQWQGKMETEDEWVVVIKTLPECYTIAVEKITNLHPYEVPAILDWKVGVNPAYYDLAEGSDSIVK